MSKSTYMGVDESDEGTGCVLFDWKQICIISPVRKSSKHSYFTIGFRGGRSLTITRTTEELASKVREGIVNIIEDKE